LDARGAELVAAARSAFIGGRRLSVMVDAGLFLLGAAFVAFRAPG
jgi:hypothetical protein